MSVSSVAGGVDCSDVWHWGCVVYYPRLLASTYRKHGLDVGYHGSRGSHWVVCCTGNIMQACYWRDKLHLFCFCGRHMP